MVASAAWAPLAYARCTAWWIAHLRLAQNIHKGVLPTARHTLKEFVMPMPQSAQTLFQNATQNVAKIIGMLQTGCGGYIDTAQIHVHQPIWETFCRNMEDPKFPDSVYQFGGIFYFGELHWNRVCR